MKFELRDLHQKISDLDIIENLQSVAKNLQKDSLKIRDYSKKNGAKYSYQTAKKRFGSWERALHKARLNTEASIHGIEYGENSIRDEFLLKDIQEVALKLNNTKLTISEYDEYGKYGSTTLIKRFGGWNNAKKKANLEVGRHYNTSVEDYLENILNIWTYLGRQPRYEEVAKPLSKYHVSSYENKFGSWKAALESFVKFIDSDSFEKETESISEDVGPNESQLAKLEPPIHTSENEIKIKRSPRKINLRLRFFILKRDRFTCQACGKSPSKNPDIELNVDHILPWSKGGETAIENLQTLCFECNQGKSNVL
ncbi:HNH endonuclease [Leptospira sp. FAT2]|uniref:homing endonuclease associated repeat-containing protein n=1 Tax=Leptospira sanjuanensis TaxID=2879643 RepID=UPI001EE8890D|nr:HNH endonuclease [Leptospira sanjuanensis]MCG6195468.1 HNH endonuclease [Leptospira sanjuanensis]